MSTLIQQFNDLNGFVKTLIIFAFLFIVALIMGTIVTSINHSSAKSFKQSSDFVEDQKAKINKIATEKKPGRWG
jgi:hypothetical protein